MLGRLVEYDAYEISKEVNGGVNISTYYDLSDVEKADPYIIENGELLHAEFISDIDAAAKSLLQNEV